jgi:hypothetical protein
MAPLGTVGSMMRGARKHTLAERDPAQHVRVCASVAAFVYLLPCRYEDILKVGFSRDPLVRMQTLHPRYFEFFDLDRAVLVGTESVADARRLEGELFQVAELHAAPAPLMVSQSAGGHTEWFRGASALLCEAATYKATAGGYALYAPAGPWLRARVAGQAEALYESTTHLLRAIEAAQAYGRRATTLEVRLRNLLDAYAVLQLAVAHRVPPGVWSWYQGSSAWQE